MIASACQAPLNPQSILYYTLWLYNHQDCKGEDFLHKFLWHSHFSLFAFFEHLTTFRTIFIKSHKAWVMVTMIISKESISKNIKCDFSQSEQECSWFCQSILPTHLGLLLVQRYPQVTWNVLLQSCPHFRALKSFLLYEAFRGVPSRRSFIFS